VCCLRGLINDNNCIRLSGRQLASWWTMATTMLRIGNTIVNGEEMAPDKGEAADKHRPGESEV